MGATLQPITLEEFLAWEAEQEERFEFDGIQPVARTGASVAHMLIVTRLIGALAPRLPLGCVPLANHLKVVTQRRVRYPDLTIVCGPVAPEADRAPPTVVFEVLSRSTALTDLRVKPHEYAEAPSVQAYVTLDQAAPRAVVRRRGGGWAEEPVEGPEAALALPEVGAEVPLAEIYAGLDLSGTPLANP